MRLCVSACAYEPSLVHVCVCMCVLYVCMCTSTVEASFMSTGNTEWSASLCDYMREYGGQ